METLFLIHRSCQWKLLAFERTIFAWWVGQGFQGWSCQIQLATKYMNTTSNVMYLTGERLLLYMVKLLSFLWASSINTSKLMPVDALLASTKAIATLQLLVHWEADHIGKIKLGSLVETPISQHSHSIRRRFFNHLWCSQGDISPLGSFTCIIQRAQKCDNTHGPSSGGSAS